MNDTPWAHIDIAGVAWTQGATKSETLQSKRSNWFWCEIDFGLPTKDLSSDSKFQLLSNIEN